MIELVNYAIICLAIIINTIGLTRIYQQNQYYIKKYLNTLIRNKKYLNYSVIFLVAFTFLNNLVGLILNLLIIIGIVYITSKKQFKIKLKITKRIIRFWIVYGLLILLLMIVFDKFYIILIFNPYLLVIVHYIVLPIELLMKKNFLSLMSKKLEEVNPIVVGITGSYGKTSSKNILNDIIKNDLYSLTTPASYNTPLGIGVTIKNELDFLHEVFIAEMGAYKIGEINDCCKIAKPKIGIITSIGKSHLESFGSVENILQGKFELIESLPSDGVAILNADDSLMMSYKIKNDCKIMTYSIDNKSDLQAFDINITNDGLNFKVEVDNKVYIIYSKLLGKHNVYNILVSILCALYLGVKIEKIVKNIRNIKPTQHRLELKKMRDYILIDDAFNSNPVGSNEAVLTLSKMNGYKVIMTPGMIEYGKEEYELNFQLGKNIALNLDYAIIVGKNRSAPFVNAFTDCNFTNYIVVENVSTGFKIFDSLQETDKILLIENDLPDIY